jgi:hypothetical protein
MDLWKNTVQAPIDVRNSGESNTNEMHWMDSPYDHPTSLQYEYSIPFADPKTLFFSLTRPFRSIFYSLPVTKKKTSLKLKERTEYNNKTMGGLFFTRQHFAALFVTWSAMSFTTSAFPLSSSTIPSRTIPQYSVVLHAEGTGGWGLGNSREMVPEEFAKGTERRAFEGYELKERGEFNRKVREDAASLRSSELDELLGVAKIAGIKVKDPTERLNKFDSDLLKDDEDLDLSV